jgi:hypothetical protein
MTHAPARFWGLHQLPRPNTPGPCRIVPHPPQTHVSQVIRSALSVVATWRRVNPFSYRAAGGLASCFPRPRLSRDRRPDPQKLPPQCPECRRPLPSPFAPPRSPPGPPLVPFPAILRGTDTYSAATASCCADTAPILPPTCGRPRRSASPRPAEAKPRLRSASHAGPPAAHSELTPQSGSPR